MTEFRAPRGVTVNGAYLFARDAAGGSGLFSNWQRVTGLSSFTLPAEVGGTTETQLMDGVLAAAALRGVGTVTGAIGGRGVHVSHLFMEERALDGGSVAIAIIKPGLTRTAVTLGSAPSAGRSIEVPDGTEKNVRAGDIVFVGGANAGDAAAVGGYDDADSNAVWHGVVAIYKTGEKTYIDVAPGVAAGGGTALQVRTPGVTWKDVVGTVNGFDGGDFQNGQQLSGNFTFTPNESMPVVTPEPLLPGVIGGWYRQGVGYQKVSGSIGL